MSEWIFLAIPIVLLAVMLLSRSGWLKVSEAQSLLSTGAVLVDVRSEAEFRTGTAAGAINIPLGDLQKKILQQQWPKEKVIIVYCASGTRSALASRQLRSLGFTNVLNLGTVSRACKAV